MSGRFFVGIDVGSASVRAGIFDASGQRLAFAVRPIAQFHPRPLFVEQSSADIWAQTCAVVKEAVAKAAIDPADIAAIGVDATCSLVVVGTDGKPVSVAEDGAAENDIIMWMDHRAAVQTNAINATHDAALAYVGGEVSSHGSRQLYVDGTTVTKAIQSAGGLTDFANHGKVWLTHTGTGQRIQVNYDEALKNPAKDPPVYPDDQINVDKRIF